MTELTSTTLANSTTARTTFHLLADLVHAHLTPAGRATAVAASLRQVGDLVDDLPLSLDAAAAGFQLLATAPAGASETAQVTARRATCGELAKIASSHLPVDAPATSILDRVSDVARMAVVLHGVADSFVGTTDPRQQAMHVTATREAGELDAYVQHISPARE